MTLPPLCQITLSMPPLNPPQEVTPLHPLPATPLVEWKTYLPPTPILTPSPSKRLPLVWSRPSRTVRRSTTLRSLRLRTKSSGSSPLSKGTPKPMNEPLTGMSRTPCTPTSRSLLAKVLMPKCTGSPLCMMDMFRPTDKNWDCWTPLTPFPSMPVPCTQASPLNPFLHGSTSYLLVPPPFMLTLPKQPTNLMTGALLWISHATANWMTTCPVSMQNLNGLRLKPGWSES